MLACMRVCVCVCEPGYDLPAEVMVLLTWGGGNRARESEDRLEPRSRARADSPRGNATQPCTHLGASRRATSAKEPRRAPTSAYGAVKHSQSHVGTSVPSPCST